MSKRTLGQISLTETRLITAGTLSSHLANDISFTYTNKFQLIGYNLTYFKFRETRFCSLKYESLFIDNEISSVMLYRQWS